jgi:phospholipid-binding lipoprotein MlaA
MKLGARCVCLLTLALAGCATQPVQLRTLPPDRPAARTMAAAQPAGVTASSTALQHSDSGADTVALPPQPLTPADAPSLRTYDPWERINRLTYRFNAHVDEAVLLPVADHYRRLPAPLRGGVHHFFGNLGELGNVANYALQGQVRGLLRSLGRLVINTTAGIGGLFDVAATVRLAARPTGFSVTLSRWGMHPGPYLVIPLLGPSTLRDAIGTLGDYGTLYAVNPLGFYRGTGSWYVDGVDVVDRRAGTDFRYFASGSPFEYDTVRFLYVRARLIEDGRLPSRAPKGITDPSQPAGK